MVHPCIERHKSLTRLTRFLRSDIKFWRSLKSDYRFEYVFNYNQVTHFVASLFTKCSYGDSFALNVCIHIKSIFEANKHSQTSFRQSPSTDWRCSIFIFLSSSPICQKMSSWQTKKLLARKEEIIVTDETHIRQMLHQQEHTSLYCLVFKWK